MLTLPRFHAVVGARVSVSSFAPLFAAIIAAIMLQMYPAAIIYGLARGLFSNPPDFRLLLFIAALGFLLPAWAAPRIALGLNGWLRHLPVSDAAHRRGLELALTIVQAPLILAVAVLAIVAHHQGISPWNPVLLRLATILAAGSLASLPVRRRWLLRPLACGAAIAAIGHAAAPPVALAALMLCEPFSGSLRRVRKSRRRGMIFSFDFAIAWRAMGWRLGLAYAAAAVPVLASLLFVTNNGLEGGYAGGAYRLGFTVSISACLALASEVLAVRRPVWPWARSLPSSCSRRVLQDALLLGIHSAPAAVLGAFLNPRAALAAAAVIPLLAFRAAASMRRVRERRFGAGSFFGEACFVSALVSLLPWLAAASVPAAYPAYRTALRTEREQKVTRWLEAHHAATGDSLSWSE